jgi:hypothetical protein
MLLNRSDLREANTPLSAYNEWTVPSVLSSRSANVNISPCRHLGTILCAIASLSDRNYIPKVVE